MKKITTALITVCLLVGCGWLGANERQAIDDVIRQPLIVEMAAEPAGQSGFITLLTEPYEWRPLVVNECINCHGEKGLSHGPATPTISGLGRDYHIRTMVAYQSGERASTVMGMIARGYSAVQITQLANHFSALPFIAARQTSDPAMVLLGRQLHQRHCAVCHRSGGQQGGAILAGQWRPYLLATINDYLTGDSRDLPDSMVQALVAIKTAHGTRGIEALTHYYAANPGSSE